MKTVVIFLGVLLVVNTFGIPLIPYKIGTNGNIYFMGTVDGKSYFMDNDTKRNWGAAEAFCKASGMRLASVEYNSQLDFLKSKSGSPNFQSEFWTAGADAQTKDQFKWTTTGRRTSDSFIILGVGASRLQCLAYDATGGHLHFHAKLCTSLAGTLCEIVH